MDAALADLDERYNAAFEAAVADGSLVAEDYVVPDWDGMTWVSGGTPDATATPAS
jgi:hypothetical protein